MAAVVQAQHAVGAGPTLASAEGGLGFGLADTGAAGGTPVTKPAATGTTYAWHKTLLLMVTSGGGATSISARKIRWATAPSAGLTGSFKTAVDTYVQATSGNRVADAGTNDAVPSTYTALSTSMQTWDAASDAAVNSTRSGDFVQVVLGVSNLYVGGAGGTIALPNLELEYLET